MIDEIGNAKIILDFFVPLINPYRSGAAVVNAFCESSLNPGAIGDKDHAFGLWQLHPDRAALILAGTTKLGAPVNLLELPNIEDQCKAIWWELQHSELHAYHIIAQAGTGEDATHAWCQYYERPADPHEPARRATLYQHWATVLGIAA